MAYKIPLFDLNFGKEEEDAIIKCFSQMDLDGRQNDGA